MMDIQLESAEAQVAFGQRLARHLLAPCVLYLEGDLGAGKTTLARGVLRGLGHVGATRSPTYTLLEPYELDACRLYHLDLYRLGDPEELEYLGLRDLMGADALWLVEWPEHGQGALPPADVRLALSYADVGAGRRLRLTAATARGRHVLAALEADDGAGSAW